MACHAKAFKDGFKHPYFSSLVSWNFLITIYSSLTPWHTHILIIISVPHALPGFCVFAHFLSFSLFLSSSPNETQLISQNPSWPTRLETACRQDHSCPALHWDLAQSMAQHKHAVCVCCNELSWCPRLFSHTVLHILLSLDSHHILSITIFSLCLNYLDGNHTYQNWVFPGQRLILATRLAHSRHARTVCWMKEENVRSGQVSVKRWVSVEHLCPSPFLGGAGAEFHNFTTSSQGFF